MNHCPKCKELKFAFILQQTNRQRKEEEGRKEIKKDWKKEERKKKKKDEALHKGYKWPILIWKRFQS